MARAPRVPPVPQPARDVRDRPDLRDGRAAPPRVALGAPTHPPQRDRHQHRPRGARRRALLADRLAPVSAGQAPTALLAGAVGVWLFYVQHQFEDTYWQSNQGWSYADAALRGSSYLKLPKVLQFLTGNVGLHHVHHLSTRIPNYHLQRAHDENAIFHKVPTLSLWDGLRAVRFKLWDQGRERLVTFAEARQSNDGG